MNEVIVGVKRIAGSTLAQPHEEATAAMNAMWLIIDGKEVPGAIQKASVTNDNGPMIVTVTFIASEYRTVDFTEKEKYLSGMAGLLD